MDKMSKDTAIAELVSVVNSHRYRGVDGKGPMTDSFPWPLSLRMTEKVLSAALQVAIAHDEEQSEPTVASGMEAPWEVQGLP